MESAVLEKTISQGLVEEAADSGVLSYGHRLNDFLKPPTEKNINKLIVIPILLMLGIVDSLKLANMLISCLDRMKIMVQINRR